MCVLVISWIVLLWKIANIYIGRENYKTNPHVPSLIFSIYQDFATFILSMILYSFFSEVFEHKSQTSNVFQPYMLLYSLLKYMDNLHNNNTINLPNKINNNSFNLFIVKLPLFSQKCLFTVVSDQDPSSITHHLAVTSVNLLIWNLFIFLI